EINNPLNIISGYAELTLKRCESNGQTHLPPEILHALRIIREESFRCKQIIEKLLSLTRMGGGRREPIDVGRVTGEVVAMLRAVEQYQGRDVRLTVSDGPAPVVPANEAELKQVVLNLVLNALEAVSSGNGRVRVDVRHAGDAVTVAVEDNGRGMTAEILDRVFEPFFTDRRGGTEPGTGLGLSITHAIVEAHGGRIRAESDGPGRGSRFIVELPVASASGFAHADTVTA
ncbi:MAG: HAMP domain-containing histidine kinase, partial [Planctomycetes bacterium]|nr:HAMP domain-containing histidine kinase [Planctomycetota bacterium]